MRARRTLDARTIARLRTSLAAWFARERRDLPWRRDPTPYRVWVSEIMLQQTTVAAVVPHFGRFMESFPTVESLARAPLDSVLGAWEGLGYYRRARHLHACAKALVERHGGTLPRDRDELRALPGIGPYTAGAIASIAFDERAALVDANVARVLSRVFLVGGDPRSGETRRRLWEIAEELVPERGASIHNQALMELGALVCSSGEAARCGECPIARSCSARARGVVARFPELEEREKPSARADLALAFSRRGAVLFLKRRSDEVWGGLWELPRVTLLPGEPDEDAARRLGRELLGCGVSLEKREASRPLATRRHTVMRERIELRVFPGKLGGEPRPRAHEELRWVSPDEMASLALSSPQRKVAPSVFAWISERGK